MSLAQCHQYLRGHKETFKTKCDMTSKLYKFVVCLASEVIVAPEQLDF